MAQSIRQDMTFGVELEFLTPTGAVDGLADDKNELRLRTRKAFATEMALLAKHTPVATLCADHKDGPTCAVCDESADAIIHPGVVVLSQERPPQTSSVHPRYQYFLVQHECLSSLDIQGEWTGLEISTPILDMSELDDGLPRLSRVLSALRKTGMRVLANESCGLHIHVGTRSGMRLMHAKKVATLVALLEHHVLLALLPYRRSETFSSRSIGQFSRFARHMSRGYVYKDMLAADSHPAMNEHLPPSWTSKRLPRRPWNYGKPSAFRDTLKLIWSSGTLVELQDGLHLREGGRAGVALYLREPGQGKPPLDSNGLPRSDKHDLQGTEPTYEGAQSTYEFRFPQMSFDGDFIKHWAELCCKMVELAMLPAPQFAALLERLTGVLEEIEDKESGLQNIWPVLGLQHQSPFWAAQLRRQEMDEDISHLDERGFLLP